MTESVQKCTINECDFDAYGEGDTCILHCPKSTYDVDFAKGRFLSSFNQALIDYIVISQGKIASNRNNLAGKPLGAYLASEPVEDHAGLSHFVEKLTIHFGRVIFPSHDSRDVFDYTKVLKKLGGIHFDKCEFHSFGLDIDEVSALYQECAFHEVWGLSNQKMLPNYKSALYLRCNFENRVHGYAEGERTLTLDADVFYNCNFAKELEFSGVELNGELFCNGATKETAITKLALYECDFHSKLLLNKFEIGEFICEDTVFHSKFELKQAVFHKFDFVNSNVKEVFDAFETKFGKFFVKKSIFSNFVGFERSEFKYPESSENKRPAVFRYVTFLKFLNFRGAKFRNGLDIENINMTMAPNFLGAEVEFAGTNRETFRIIKSSFDRSGNQIEGNKSFAQEMLKYREELSDQPMSQERVVFWLNQVVSNFGQSYVRPLAWIVVSGLLFALLSHGYEQSWLYKVIPSLNEEIASVTGLFNSFALSLLPFHRLLVPGMEFISLIFGVIVSSLVWQVIVAVKRHTKR